MKLLSPHFLPVLLFVLCLALPGTTAPVPTTEIDDLIKQLGDDEFAAREEASARLTKMGEPALEALRRAAKEHPDPEVRGRAADVVRIVEKELRGEILAFGQQAPYWLNRVAFTPDGKQAVVTGGAVLVYDLATGNELRRDHELQNARCGLALSKDGKYFFTGHQRDRSVRMGDVATLQVARSFDGHTGGVWAVALSPNEERLVSGGEDRTIRLWDVKTGKEMRQLAGVNEQVLALSFSPDGKQVASGHFGPGSTFAVHLWDVETGKEVRAFKAHTNEVTAVLFAPDGKQLISAGADGLLIVWDVETGKQVRRLTHGGGIHHAALSPDGKRVLTAGFGDHLVRLWDLASGRELRHLDGHPGAVLGVAFSADGKRALSCDSQCTVRLWKMPE